VGDHRPQVGGCALRRLQTRQFLADDVGGVGREQPLADPIGDALARLGADKAAKFFNSAKGINDLRGRGQLARGYRHPRIIHTVHVM
jgi:hypothetical protein